jgi:hypothetical protein
MGWGDPCFCVVWFRGSRDGMIPPEEYSLNMLDEDIPQNIWDEAIHLC